MTVRLYLDAPLEPGAELTLPPEVSRHVQVLRLQPGHSVCLFNGQGGEWAAEVLHMGRHDVSVRVGTHRATDRELPRRIHLALGMPANERMDALVEKATELGVAGLQPLHTARSVLRLSGERADKRRTHWQGVAVAAAEQSARTAVPQVAAVANVADWLGRLSPAPAADERRLILSFASDAHSHRSLSLDGVRSVWCLSGPEGGLDEREEALARSRGFVPLSLGPRVLRADTAPLLALAWAGTLA